MEYFPTSIVSAEWNYRSTAFNGNSRTDSSAAQSNLVGNTAGAGHGRPGRLLKSHSVLSYWVDTPLGVFCNCWDALFFFFSFFPLFFPGGGGGGGGVTAHVFCGVDYSNDLQALPGRGGTAQWLWTG